MKGKKKGNSPQLQKPKITTIKNVTEKKRKKTQKLN